jgi:hypothetical protein
LISQIFFGVFLFFGEHASAGQYCTNWSFNAGGMSSSGKQCFVDEKACKAGIEAAKDKNGDAESFTLCRDEGGGPNSTNASSANNAGLPGAAPGVNELLNQSASALGKGMATGNSQMMGAGVAGIGGAIVLQSLFGDKESDAAAQAAAAQAAAQAKARADAEAQRTDQVRDRLLGQMQGVVTSDRSDDVALMGTTTGTGTNFFGSGNGGIQLLHSGDGASASTPQPPAIAPDSAAVSIGGVGLMSAAPDGRAAAAQPSMQMASATTPANPRPAPVRASELNQSAAILQEASIGVTPRTASAALASWPVMPLLRGPDDANGHPVDDGKPSSTCQTLTSQINATYALVRRAVLAANAYDRYDGGDRLHPENGSAAAILPLKMDRISDNPGAMAKLFPNTNRQTLEQLLAPPGSGYRAALYSDPNDRNKIFLVFRGTAELGDWTKGNIPQQIGKGSVYFDKAIALAKLVKARADANGLPMEIVGHSLGGGMADAAGVVTGVQTTSFNPEGVHPNTLPAGVDLGAAQRFDTDIVVKGEPLNLAQDNRETVKALYDAVVIGAAGAQAMTDPDLARSLSRSSLAPAIGKRVTIDPLPDDAVNPLTLHRMTGVVDALSHQFDSLFDQYKSFGCRA